MSTETLTKHIHIVYFRGNEGARYGYCEPWQQAHMAMVLKSGGYRYSFRECSNPLNAETGKCGGPR